MMKGFLCFIVWSKEKTWICKILCCVAVQKTCWNEPVVNIILLSNTFKKYEQLFFQMLRIFEKVTKRFSCFVSFTQIFEYLISYAKMGVKNGFATLSGDYHLSTL